MSQSFHYSQYAISFLVNKSHSYIDFHIVCCHQGNQGTFSIVDSIITALGMKKLNMGVVCI
jgi:hypothetical protein